MLGMLFQKNMLPLDLLLSNAQTSMRECGKRNVSTKIWWKELRCSLSAAKKGDVKLPQVPPMPLYLSELYKDKTKSSAFQRNISLYNSMFCFISTGGNIDHSVNEGRGPYIYRLNGQNHHIFGSLIPNECDTPKLC